MLVNARLQKYKGKIDANSLQNGTDIGNPPANTGQAHFVLEPQLFLTCQQHLFSSGTASSKYRNE
jgi:hypothetical protein